MSAMSVTSRAPRQRLTDLSAVLLDVSACPGDLRVAADELFDWLAGLIDLDRDTGSSDAVDTLLSSGKALSPALAATCLLDHRRTAVFLQGVHAAILEAQRRFPGQRIEILYAGTGPFAILALPMMLRFERSEIRFTFIDIHERSIAAARKLVTHFGCEAYVREFLVADATLYVQPAGAPLHMLVVETMQSALAKEPQVAIVRHLLPQLEPEGILIPQRITVDLTLMDAAAETRRAMGEPLLPDNRVALGTVIDLTAHSAGLPLDADGCFAPTVVRVPDLDSMERYWLAYLTRIDVFGEHCLRDYDSGLTYPKLVTDVSPRSGETLVLRYRIGDRPGLTISSGGPARAPLLNAFGLR
jgi:predicted RNA methylase